MRAKQQPVRKYVLPAAAAPKNQADFGGHFYMVSWHLDSKYPGRNFLFDEHKLLRFVVHFLVQLVAPFKVCCDKAQTLNRAHQFRIHQQHPFLRHSVP